MIEAQCIRDWMMHMTASPSREGLRGTPIGSQELGSKALSSRRRRHIGEPPSLQMLIIGMQFGPLRV